MVCSAELWLGDIDAAEVDEAVRKLAVKGYRLSKMTEGNVFNNLITCCTF